MQKITALLQELAGSAFFQVVAILHAVWVTDVLALALGRKIEL
jgi:hypothetical protein